MRRAPDTRAIKQELQHGNPYMVALLHARGLVYLRGSGIVRMREVEQVRRVRAQLPAATEDARAANLKQQGETYAPK